METHRKVCIIMPYVSVSTWVCVCVCVFVISPMTLAGLCNAVLHCSNFQGPITHLESLPHCLQQVWHQGVVPQVGEPHPRPVYIHGAGQEQPWA